MINLCDGTLLHGRFFNNIMIIRHSRNLRQMGNADHLVLFGNYGHLLRNLLCRTSADAGINLIENQCLNGIRIGQNRFDRQHNSR